MQEIARQIKTQTHKGGTSRRLYVSGFYVLQRVAPKTKLRKILKALPRNAFKIFLVVRLIGNCCQ